ncbi:hypothetical protein D9611_011162 [Ephemerocybe angulata]|uniref:Uncharacterized protein n=1 Tax=Ephemerocybe angulata TaxID=980116 RepID=A0A8H5FJ65_9AGAR|nr:hypothetical protein D9611_011162 [Tulosesus angulatus]
MPDVQENESPQHIGPLELTSGNLDSPTLLHSVEALKNEDILTLVLLELKRLLEQDALPPASLSRWESVFASLLRISGPFFRSGIDILWNEMKSLVPAFKLLPWYNGKEYRGVETYKYTGAREWDRFSLYASRIKRLRLFSFDENIIPDSLILQLLNLHGRPEPLFPALQFIRISHNAWHAQSQVFFLAFGKALDCLEVSVVGQPNQSTLLAFLPTIPLRASNLTDIKYWGPGGTELLYHIACISTLTHLELHLKKNVREDDMLLLRRLEKLRTFVLNLRPPNTVTPMFTRTTQPANLFPEGLEVLNIAASGAAHRQICNGIILSPQLLDLRLVFADPIFTHDAQTVLVTAVKASPFLQILSIEHSGEDTDTFHLPTFLRNPVASEALSSASRLTKASFTHLPVWLAQSLLPSVQQAIPHWKHLTTLRFQLKFSLPHGPPQINPDSRFPDMRFLATIQQACPDLEVLEFHFDDALEGVPLHDELKEFPPLSHPLRTLEINTFEKLYSTVDLDRKVQIAVYLFVLFPGLETVDGTADAFWKDVDTLLASYQSLHDLQM